MYIALIFRAPKCANSGTIYVEIVCGLRRTVSITWLMHTNERVLAFQLDAAFLLYTAVRLRPNMLQMRIVYMLYALIIQLLLIKQIIRKLDNIYLASLCGASDLLSFYKYSKLMWTFCKYSNLRVKLHKIPICHHLHSTAQVHHPLCQLPTRIRCYLIYARCTKVSVHTY